MHPAINPARFALWLLLGIVVFTELQATEYLDPGDYSTHKLFAITLFKEKDFYRTISEIYRIKFVYSENIDPELELMLLQSYFFLKQHDRVIEYSKNLLQTPKLQSDPYYTYKISTTLAASSIEIGNIKQAADIWNRNCVPIIGEPFPNQQSFPEPVDADKAKLYSAFLPGSGLLMSREYGKATVSFLLNAIFIAGIYHYGSEQQYGIAGLLTFFEIGWYFGGQNAAYESAENYNKKYIQSAQKAWIADKMN